MCASSTDQDYTIVDDQLTKGFKVIEEVKELVTSLLSEKLKDEYRDTLEAKFDQIKAILETVKRKTDSESTNKPYYYIVLPDVCLLNGQLPTQLTPTAVTTPEVVTPPLLNELNNVNLNNNNHNNNAINNVVDAAAVPVQEPVVGAAALLEPAAPVAGVRLNPAPAVVAEEDEDFVQRDWIDWLSFITRGVALASFIYLYASFGRFMLVTVLYFLYRLLTSVVEAYNAFLAIGAPRQRAPGDPQNHGANNNNNNNNNNNYNNNNNPNDGPNRLQQVMDGNIDDHHANNSDNSNNNNSNNNDNNNSNNNPVGGQRSSNERTKIRLFFTMIKALFSSLIPLQPPPLYPNRG